KAFPGCARSVLPGEPFDPGGTAGTEGGGEIGGLQDLVDLARDRRRTGRVEEGVIAADHLGDAARRRPDDGGATGHRLEDGQAEALVQRRQDGKLAGAVEEP